MKGSAPLLESVDIRFNYADSGAGIYCEESTPEIIGGSIEGNGDDA